MAAEPQSSGYPAPNLGVILPEAAKTAFWGVVEDCLVKFHRIQKSTAHAKTNVYRKKLAKVPDAIDVEFIYHEEPFYVACGIAGMERISSQERLLKRSRVDYELMKDARGW